jgi:hypothetical protein
MTLNVGFTSIVTPSLKKATQNERILELNLLALGRYFNRTDVRSPAWEIEPSTALLYSGFDLP